MKNILFIFSFILAFNSYGQELADYKFVVVPEKFAFLKEADQYQLNSLTKFLFEKNGLETFMEGEESLEKPGRDRCEGLNADVLSDSGMFRTKLTLVLKDCRNRQVFISEEGVSREKDYKAAYQDALRKAFESLSQINFSKPEVIVSGTPNLNISTTIQDEPNRGEVKGEIQNDKKSEIAQKENRPVNDAAGRSSASSEMNFTRDGRNYFLQITDKGYSIFHKGTPDPFATLIRSSAGNSFIYNSMTSKGIACFDNEGNLVIEILKEDGNSLETVIYRPHGQ